MYSFVISSFLSRSNVNSSLSSVSIASLVSFLCKCSLLLEQVFVKIKLERSTRGRLYFLDGIFKQPDIYKFYYILVFAKTFQ